MLSELRVENLLLMERAELRLGPGLNVLTGETGAGKTLLAHALDLLLGGKARAGIVRRGAAEAYVEGVFELPPDLAAGGDERIPADAEELVLARRVWPDGRTRAYVCGRAASAGALRELGGRLLEFYGQHEHRRLMLATAQMDALDAFCGSFQAGLRERMEAVHSVVRALEQRLAGLAALAGARERELDLLEFELGEIERIAPTVAEEQQLLLERERLRHQAALQGGGSLAAEMLVPEDGEGAAALLTRAAEAVDAAARLDPGLAPLQERLAVMRYEAEDVAGELRAYVQRLESEPGRLESVEERLGAFAKLARKHGGGIVEVLAHADACRERRASLLDADTTLEGLTAELEQARLERERIGVELSKRRAAGAVRLAAAVREHLADLAMPDARFEVVVEDRADGYGVSGHDVVEFLIASNPGLPSGSLREVASGGELSRVMLALLSAAHCGTDVGCAADGDGNGAGDRQETGDLSAGDGALRVGRAPDKEQLLVFDEIDAGVGGHTARAVGAHLRRLADGRQILCITHLPQVAAMADRHFTIVKDESLSPPRTSVSPLAGEQVVEELARMLGADDADTAARGHARELLRAA